MNFQGQNLETIPDVSSKQIICLFKSSIKHAKIKYTGWSG